MTTTNLAQGLDLRAWRAGRGISAAALAEGLGVHRASVLRWERRERLPGPDHVRSLASLLGLDCDEVAAFFDSARPGPARVTTVRGVGLRRLRQQSGLQVTSIAMEIGVRSSTIYNWESGRVGIPHDLLAALATTLETTVPILVRDLSRPPPVDSHVSLAPLRRLRRLSGLSQAQVADQAGVARYRISAWERGARPPLSGLRRLARVYGVPTATVADAAGVMPPQLLDPARWTPGELHAVLRVLRAWSGMTQRDLASRLGCSPAAVRGWEGGRARPRPASRVALERLYGLPEGSLLTTFPSRR